MFLERIEEPWIFSFVTVAIFLIIVLRYFLVAGIFFLVFNYNNPKQWFQRKINQNRSYRSTQYYKEVFWSITTSVIFALAGSLTILAWHLGYTKIYIELSWLDLIYGPFSLALVMFIHETYYYWVHRWMHLPKVFKLLHKVHHESLVTSAWTAFSFHPLEGLLQAIILPLILFVVPMHPVTILVLLSIMTISSVVNHLDVELYPKGFESHWLGKWIIGATHHSLHHQKFHQNFGLYFTFWDRWLKTESENFESLFREKTK